MQVLGPQFSTVSAYRTASSNSPRQSLVGPPVSHRPSSANALKVSGGKNSEKFLGGGLVSVSVWVYRKGFRCSKFEVFIVIIGGNRMKNIAE